MCKAPTNYRFLAVGGLHSGTKKEQDPCYHKACDDYDNINPTLLTVNAKTTAHVLSILAMEGETMMPSSLHKREFPMGEAEKEVGIMQWYNMKPGERHTGNCHKEHHTY